MPLGIQLLRFPTVHRLSKTVWVHLGFRWLLYWMSGCCALINIIIWTSHWLVVRIYFHFFVRVEWSCSAHWQLTKDYAMNLIINITTTPACITASQLCVLSSKADLQYKKSRSFCVVLKRLCIWSACLSLLVLFPESLLRLLYLNGSPNALFAQQSLAIIITAAAVVCTTASAGVW